MVAGIVIAIGAVAGLLAGTLVTRTSVPDIDDPHVPRSTIRRAVAEHRLARWIARGVPTNVGTALAEGLAVAAVVVTLAAAAAGVTLVMIRTGTGFSLVDMPIAEWAAEQATSGSTTIMRELSKFGGTEYIVVAAVVTLAVAWSCDRRAGRWAVRPRCDDRPVSRVQRDQVVGRPGASVPVESDRLLGHVVPVGARRRRGRRVGQRCVPAGTRTSAVRTGCAVRSGGRPRHSGRGTRVALGVHWTTDVIVGLLIGWSWFAVCALLFGGRRVQPAEPLLIAAENVDEVDNASSRAVNR